MIRNFGRVQDCCLLKGDRKLVRMNYTLCLIDIVHHLPMGNGLEGTDMSHLDTPLRPIYINASE